MDPITFLKRQCSPHPLPGPLQDLSCHLICSPLNADTFSRAWRRGWEEDTKSGGDWLPEQPFLSSPGSQMLPGGIGFQQRQGHLSQGWDLATGSGRGPIECEGYEQGSAALDLF